MNAYRVTRKHVHVDEESLTHQDWWQDPGVSGEGFEQDLLVSLHDKAVCVPPDPCKVIGVGGRCDWIGTGLKLDQTAIDVLEVKLVRELGNAHRLQVLAPAVPRLLPFQPEHLGTERPSACAPWLMQR